MGRDEILVKLRKFAANQDFSNESSVVYYMVELRKLLEHRRDTKYGLLRFYCDWTVHITKDKAKGAIRTIASKIKEALEKSDKSREDYVVVLNFLRMNELMKEINSFSAETELVLFGDNKWSSFSKSLARVLSQQPINNPISGINKIEFDAADDVPMVVIDLDNGGSYSVGMHVDMY